MPPLLALNDPIGPAPPSPGMRVERYEIAAGLEYADRHEDQVVALYLKPASLHYAPQPSASSRPLSLGPHLATICRRRQTETICWAGAASLLCVSVSDGALNEAARFLRGSERIEIRPAPEAHDPALTNLLHASRPSARRTTRPASFFSTASSMRLPPPWSPAMATDTGLPRRGPAGWRPSG